MLDPFLWLDMALYKLEGDELTIAAIKDLTTGHQYEFIFRNVFNISLNLEWKTTPAKGLIRILDGSEAYSFNAKNRIEIGNYLFYFINDDNLELIIAASEFYYHERNVKY